MPKTSTPAAPSKSKSLISLDDLYAAPVPVTCTLDTQKGPVTIEMKVQTDRISVEFMSREMELKKKVKEFGAEDAEQNPEAVKALFDSMVPWISELVVDWNLASPPTEATARSLGVEVLTQIVSTLKGMGQIVSDNPDDPNA